MFTALGSAFFSGLFALVSGVIPDLLKEFKDSRDAKREREHTELLHKLEIERIEKGVAAKIQEATIAAEGAEASAWATAYAAAMQQASVPLPDRFAWIEAFNRIVRPLVTLIMVILFGLVALGLNGTIPSATVAPAFVEIVSGIFGFWFVDRRMSKPAVCR